MSQFESTSSCINHLGKSLSKSRLALFLGAGISQNFGLPGWEKLVSDLCHKCGVEKQGNSFVRLATLCKNKVGNKQFNAFVKDILYDGFNPDMLISYPLLVSISSLCTGSTIRGTVKRIVTYNYDNLVEIFLTYYGIKPQIITSFPYYSQASDVQIFHPHGYLSYTGSYPDSDVVLDRVALNEARDGKFWNELEIIVKHSTLLFLGLSFDDENLESLLIKSRADHPASISDEPIGFYFITKDSLSKEGKTGEKLLTVENNLVKVEYFKGLDLWPIIISDWSDLAPHIARICRESLEA